MANTAAEVVEVAVGIARRPDGHVLIARRPEGKIRGNLWEFPGGKLEAGESAAQALGREWMEELGVRVQVGADGYHLSHAYPDITVRLHVFTVEMLGSPVAQEGQILRWAAPERLEARDFVAADRHVLTRLRLPSLLLISQVEALGTETWLTRLEGALKSGVRLVQLREHQLDDHHYERLGARCEALCDAYGASLIYNRDPEWVLARPRGGLHVTSAILGRLNSRPISDSRWFGVSCHSADELALAVRLGADYATLGPVCRTKSHPEAVPIGWQRYQELVTGLGLPVLAQGGLSPKDAQNAVQHGGHGIAFIRGAAGWEDSPALCADRARPGTRRP